MKLRAHPAAGGLFWVPENARTDKAHRRFPQPTRPSKCTPEPYPACDLPLPVFLQHHKTQGVCRFGHMTRTGEFIHSVSHSTVRLHGITAGRRIRPTDPRPCQANQNVSFHGGNHERLRTWKMQKTEGLRTHHHPRGRGSICLWQRRTPTGRKAFSRRCFESNVRDFDRGSPNTERVYRIPFIGYCESPSP